MEFLFRSSDELILISIEFFFRFVFTVVSAFFKQKSLHLVKIITAYLVQHFSARSWLST